MKKTEDYKMTETIELKCAKGEALNPIADYMLSEKSGFIERMSDFQLITGTPQLFGSGDDKILTIKISFTNPTEQDLDDLDSILSIAKKDNLLKNSREIEIHLETLRKNRD